MVGDTLKISITAVTYCVLVTYKKVILYDKNAMNFCVRLPSHVLNPQTVCLTFDVLEPR